MTKNSIFALIFLMMFSFVVEDTGAGGGDDLGDNGADIDDFEVDDEIEIDEPSKKDEADEPPSEVDELKKQVGEQSEFIESVKAERAVVAAVEDIVSTKGYEDFDIGQVKEHLETLQKDNPELADELNNPTGWKLIHKELNPQTRGQQEDEFDPGRKANENFDWDKSAELAQNGDREAAKALLRNAK